MPTREMRGRYVQREWFSDYEFMSGYSAEQREVYLGLAMFADDEGWLPWTLQEIANGIYRFLSLERAIEKVNEAVVPLTADGRLKVYKCGHAFLPKVSKRPRSGVRDSSIRDQHQANCGSKKADRGSIRDQPSRHTLPNSNRTLPNPKSGLHNQPQHSPAGAKVGKPDGPTSLAELIPGVKEKLAKQ